MFLSVNCVWIMLLYVQELFRNNLYRLRSILAVETAGSKSYLMFFIITENEVKKQ